MKKEMKKKDDKKNMKKKKEIKMEHGDMKQDLAILKKKIKTDCMK